MKDILVALDGSLLAEAILPYAAAIAKGFNSKLTLLNAIDIAGVSFFEYDEYGNRFDDWSSFEDLERYAAEGARDYLDAQVNRLKEMNIEAEARIDHGHAADVIIDYVESRNPDLVAMSTHGRSGVGRFLLGSATSRVLRHSKAPLLVVRPQEEIGEPVARLTDIVIPLDASKMSESVLPAARELARTLELSVTLVTVIPTASQLYIGTELVSYPRGALDAIEAGLREYLERTSDMISEEDDLNVQWEVLHGDPGSAIVEYARDEFQNNLIAMSTHGRSGLRRWLLGSVTDKVVRSSGDPVIVVRPGHG